MKKIILFLLLSVSFTAFGQLTDAQVRDTINTKLSNNTSRKITEKTFRDTFLTLLNYTNQLATGTPIDLGGLAPKDTLSYYARLSNLAPYAGKDTLTYFARLANLSALAGKDTLANFAQVSQLANYATNANLNSTNTTIAGKVDKVAGKGLSTNDLTAGLFVKLNGIANGATANDTDVNLRTRGTHIGVQDATTITESSSKRFVSDTEKTTWNGKQSALGFTPANAATVTTQLAAKSDTATVNSVANSRVPHATSIQLRAGIVGYPNAVILSDMQGYTFRYDPTNTTMSDDSAMIIRQGNRRYVRVSNVLKPEFFGSDGRGPINDGVAIQKSMNAVKVWGYDVVLTDTLYTTNITLSYTGNAQYTTGIKIIGAGQKTTKIKASGFSQSIMLINGNTSGTAGYHIKNVVLKDFTIEGNPASGVNNHGLELMSLEGSEIKNLIIKKTGGDGLRLTGTTGYDTGATTTTTFENIITESCNLWGVRAVNTFTQGVPVSLCEFRYIVSISCGEGMYFEGIQMNRFYDCVSVNSNNYNLRFGKGNTPSHLTEINGFELGNNYRGDNVPTATGLSIENVQQFDAKGIRIVNNSGEVMYKGIDFGSLADSYIFGVTIEEPWIIQGNSANALMANYTLFNFDPIVTARANVVIMKPFYSSFVQGKISNNISKASFYADEFNKVITNFAENSTYIALNTTSVFPTYDQKNYLLTYTTGINDVIVNTPTANVKYSNQTPKGGAEMFFTVRNFGGLNSIVFNGALKTTNLTVPSVGSHVVFHFRFDDAAGEWYQVAAPTDTKTRFFLLGSTQNSTSITRADVSSWIVPVVAGKKYEFRVHALYRTAATTTGGSLGVYLKGGGTGYLYGKFDAEIDANNTNAIAVSATLTGINSDPTTSKTYITTTGSTPAGTNHFIGGSFFFYCATSGNLAFQWGTEVAGSMATLEGSSGLIVQEL